jgi:acetoin utilization protein AcuB
MPRRTIGDGATKLMKEIPPIKSVMTPFPHFIDGSEPLKRAAELMTSRNIEHLPVVEGERLVGLLTEREVRTALEEVARGLREPAARVKDACVGEAYVVALSEPLDVVLRRMARTNVESALVVKEGRLVGIFTRTDACRCFGELLRSLFPRDHDDDAA